MIQLDVLVSPAEQERVRHRDLSQTACAVFDVLRATSTMLEMLAHGATAIRPVCEINEAVALHRQNPKLLLAGERHGLRLSAADTGGIEFDFGNSPREFRSENVAGHEVVMTTTNGTRALQACAHAAVVWIAAFTNLGATARALLHAPAHSILLVCSGTGSGLAYEDVLGAGALIDRLLSPGGALPIELSDAAHAALDAYRAHCHDLPVAIRAAANARRLLSLPELADDVAACLEIDRHGFAARLHANGLVCRA